MAAVAYRAFEHLRLPNSCFASIDRNDAVIEKRWNKWYGWLTGEPRWKEWRVRRQQRLAWQADDLGDCPKRAAIRTSDDFRPRQFYALSTLRSTGRKLLLRWLGDRAMTMETRCPRCATLGRQPHWDRCFGLDDIVIYAFEHDFAKAIAILSPVVDRYHLAKATAALSNRA